METRMNFIRLWKDGSLLLPTPFFSNPSIARFPWNEDGQSNIDLVGEWKTIIHKQ